MSSRSQIKQAVKKRLETILSKLQECESLAASAEPYIETPRLQNMQQEIMEHLSDWNSQ